MGMFLIKKGTPVKAVRDDNEWIGGNIKSTETIHVLIFGKEDLRVDPSGLSKIACGPTDRSVPAGWAEEGHYGFAWNGWTILIDARYVAYG